MWESADILFVVQNEAHKIINLQLGMDIQHWTLHTRKLNT